ncbi:hypothetical protein ACIA8K_16440 [Catenuloplanes sp. NPDC051500]|uniref:hypothetical protein n=1 Tax=Catenuloplanes sp. NPDC051500 TaxID=3363959 RepID=UPI0037B71EC6
MSDDLLRWDALADDLAFHQLPTVRKQAEAWRTGLAGLTGLLGAVLIVKGRDTVAELSEAYRVLILIGLGLGLVLLVSATLIAIRAASGSPDDHTLLTAEDLRRWTGDAVKGSLRDIRWARALTLAGIAVVAVAIGVSWLAPSPPKDGLVLVEAAGSSLCGTLSASPSGMLTVARGREVTVVALPTVTRMTPVTRCP